MLLFPVAVDGQRALEERLKKESGRETRQILVQEHKIWDCCFFIQNKQQLQFL